MFLHLSFCSRWEGVYTPPDTSPTFPLRSTSGRYPSYWNAFLFLPPATVVAERLCFHRCLSVHRGQVYTSPRHTPPLDRHPAPQIATAGDGTHPTGMHSCFFLMFGGHQSFLLRRMILNDTMFKRHAKVWLSKCDVKDYCNTK